MPPQGDPQQLLDAPRAAISAEVGRDQTGTPCVVIMAGVPAAQVRLQLDPISTIALGQMLLQLARDANAQLIIPNGQREG
jgi:hypothetical protein